MGSERSNAMTAPSPTDKDVAFSCEVLVLPPILRVVFEIATAPAVPERLTVPAVVVTAPTVPVLETLPAVWVIAPIVPVLTSVPVVVTPRAVTPAFVNVPALVMRPVWESETAEPTERAAPFETETVPPLPSEPVPLRANVPPVTAKLPVKVFAPESERVPLPALVSEPVPPNVV